MENLAVSLAVYLNYDYRYLQMFYVVAIDIVKQLSLSAHGGPT